ncbi:hypothetical protein CISG_01934 [Coccidioides immitis RMSCC 3703]|uniref:Uncharacterized protein n=1 Tax=Coccidioides immitis RMSCC 3703 TaxID=454286 RepID=A0A0J8R451_COCIT|nr:hypothetical protein CISG_01934 [Coccidioides immitis RMSCC 3703]
MPLARGFYASSALAVQSHDSSRLQVLTYPRKSSLLYHGFETTMRKTGSSTRVKTAKKLSQHFFHTIALLTSKRLMTNPDVTGELIPSRAFLGKEEKAAPQLVVLAQRASISTGEPHGSGKLDIPWIARTSDLT